MLMAFGRLNSQETSGLSCSPRQTVVVVVAVVAAAAAAAAATTTSALIATTTMIQVTAAVPQPMPDCL